MEVYLGICGLVVATLLFIFALPSIKTGSVKKSNDGSNVVAAKEKAPKSTATDSGRSENQSSKADSGESHSTSSGLSSSEGRSNDKVTVAQEERRRITKISIKAGAIVDGIAVAYSDAHVVRSHGGECSAASTEWKGAMLDLQAHEYVKMIEVKHGKFVQRLCLTTNTGRRLGPCGGGGALFLGGKGLFLGSKGGKHTTVHAPEGCMLVGIHGRAGKYLDAIGFHWAPVAACYAEGDGVAPNNADLARSLASTQLFGGRGGGAFDHGHFALP